MSPSNEDFVEFVESMKQKKGIDKAIAQNAALLRTLDRERVRQVDDTSASRKVSATINIEIIKTLSMYFRKVA